MIHEGEREEVFPEAYGARTKKLFLDAFTTKQLECIEAQPGISETAPIFS
jgi:hypothetical protein